MELRSRQLSLPEFDSEGYPVSDEAGTLEALRTPLDSQVTSHLEALKSPLASLLDEENGELFNENIVVLRRRPTATSNSAHPSLDHLYFDHLPFMLLQEKLYTQGLEACDLQIDSNGVVYSLELCSDELAASHICHDGYKQDGYENERTRRRFQIPPKYLTNTSSEKKPTDTIYINIWQEFIYGPPVIMLRQYCLTREELRGLTDVSSCLSQFVHKNIVDILLYAFFFGIYFVSCCIFNNILELAFYISYGGHLCIHDLASTSNVNLKFSGSIFQGPAYVLIRTFCKHCTQRDNAKVMRHLMKKMKRDIMEATTS